MRAFKTAAAGWGSPAQAAPLGEPNARWHVSRTLGGGGAQGRSVLFGSRGAQSDVPCLCPGQPTVLQSLLHTGVEVPALCSSGTGPRAAENGCLLPSFCLVRSVGTAVDLGGGEPRWHTARSAPGGIPTTSRAFQSWVSGPGTGPRWDANCRSFPFSSPWRCAAGVSVTAIWTQGRKAAARRKACSSRRAPAVSAAAPGMQR